MYSAVLTAFLIESYQSLQPDTGTEIVFLLRHSLAQNYTINSGFLNSTAPFAPGRPFEAPLWALRVNGLWFASLICSLSTASIGMLTKQWLREYLAMEWISPQERLRARQYRNPGLARWRVFEIAAALPVLLHVSLGLFFLGLCIFTSAIDERIGHSTIPLIAAWAFFVALTVIAPLFSPRCPYKIPMFRSVAHLGRRYVLGSVRRALNLPRHEEERDVISKSQDDLDILLSVDKLMADDGLLDLMWDVLRKSSPLPHTAVRFVLGAIKHRLDFIAAHPIPDSLQNVCVSLDLRLLSKRVSDSLLTVVAHTVSQHISQLSTLESVGWCHDAFRVLLADAHHRLPEFASTVLSCEDSVLPILGFVRKSFLLPEEIVRLTRAIFDAFNRLPETPPTTPNARLLATSHLFDSRRIPETVWEPIETILCEVLHRNRHQITIGEARNPEWAVQAITMLVSNSHHPFSRFSITADNQVLYVMLNQIRHLRWSPRATMTFVLSVIRHRLDVPAATDMTALLDTLHSSTKESLAVMTNIMAPLVLHTLRQHVPISNADAEWIRHALLFLFYKPYPALSAFYGSDNTLFHSDDRFLTIWLNNLAPLVHTLDPTKIVDFMLSIVAARHQIGSDAVELFASHAARCTSDVDLAVLPDEIQRGFVDMAGQLLRRGDDVQQHRGPLPKWVQNATRIVFSRSSAALPEHAYVDISCDSLVTLAGLVDGMVRFGGKPQAVARFVTSILRRRRTLATDHPLQIAAKGKTVSVLKLCWVFVQLYGVVDPNPTPLPTAEGVQDDRPWSRIWLYLAAGIREYHATCKDVSLRRDQLRALSIESIDPDDALFGQRADGRSRAEKDRAWSNDCLSKMDLLEISYRTSLWARDASVFPEDLREALQLFALTDETAKSAVRGPVMSGTEIVDKLARRGALRVYSTHDYELSIRTSEDRVREPLL